MRLWHQDLIPGLPHQQLGGQHRECCALRGNGWGRPHSTVNYVFKHNPALLYSYHMLIIQEKLNRYQNAFEYRWMEPLYRGFNCPPWSEEEFDMSLVDTSGKLTLYPEHDERYFLECVENMLGKGVPKNQFYDADGYFRY